MTVMTGLVMLGSQAEQDITVLDNPSTKRRPSCSIKKKLAQDPSFYSRTKAQIQGLRRPRREWPGFTRCRRAVNFPSPPSTSTTQSPRASSTTSRPPRTLGQHQARHRCDGGRQAGPGDGHGDVVGSPSPCAALEPPSALPRLIRSALCRPPWRAIASSVLRMWSRTWTSS